MMNRDDLERYVSRATNLDINEIVWALIDNDTAKLTEIRAVRALRQAIAKTYLDAYDAAKDDDERYAVQCCVRLNEALRPAEYSTKVADIKAGRVEIPEREMP
jgi:hypothetical protein